MANFGFIILLLALFAAFYMTSAAAAAGFARKESLFQSARFGMYATTALTSVASLALIYSFLTHDFALKYVAGYSGKAVPTFYLVLGLWGGMEGSLLFWAWLLSIFGAIVVWQNRARNRELMPHVMWIVGIVQLFFLGLLVFSANPFFEHAGGLIPLDGKGLNPLLQTPAMAIHPPNLYLGFVGCTIPFAFAIAALITRRLDDAWIKTTRKWAIVAWTFLTVGNLLGANWAYTELGWGGAWGWDPVENAALMPWFPLTAYLHSVMIQERRGMLKVWNVFLILLTFLMTIFGTFLTRSGIISSVHSFAQSDVGTYFLIFIGLLVMGCFGLLFARLNDLKSENTMDSSLSREFLFLLNNLVLLGMMLVIFVGTMFPKLSELFLDQPVSIASPWFNEVLTPMGLALLLLLGIGPLMPWGRATPSALVHQFKWPAAVGVAVAIAAPLLGATGWGPIAFFALLSFVLTTIVQEMWRGTRVRMKNAGESVAEAWLKLVTKARRRYGGYIIHLGVVLTFFAWTGAFFSAEDKYELKRGQTVEFAGWTLTYQGLRSELDDEPLGTEAAMKRFDQQDWHLVKHLAVVDVAQDGKKVTTLYPGRHIYRTHPEQPTTEIDTHTTLLGDLYLVMQGFDNKGETATIKAFKNPLMVWWWIGGSVMLFGGLTALWPDRQILRARVRLGALVPSASMVRSWLLWLVAGALVASLIVWASVAQASPRERRGEVSKNQRVTGIAKQLMCPCPTCNWAKILATCGCGGADQEITRIEKDVVAGRTDKEIVDARVALYGWRILTRPPDTAANRIAWLLPYLIIGVALLALSTLAYGLHRSKARRALRVKASSPLGGSAALASVGSGGVNNPYEQQLDDELRRLDK